MKIRVIAERLAHELEAAVCDDLVRVHVGRGSCATLNNSDHELVVELATDDLLAHLIDQIGFACGERTQFFIGTRCGLLHHSERLNEFRVHGDGSARDREVLPGSLGMDSPICISRDVEWPYGIFFTSGRTFVVNDGQRAWRFRHPVYLL